MSIKQQNANAPAESDWFQHLLTQHLAKVNPAQNNRIGFQTREIRRASTAKHSTLLATQRIR